MTAQAGMKALLTVAGLAFGTSFCLPALAQQSCEGDIGKLQDKRMSVMKDINSMQNKGDGKLDPIAACPKLRSLAGIEKDMLSYMEKNQSWCNIPDEVLENVKAGSGKTAQIATQACNLAAQARKQQQQAAGGGGPGFAAPSSKLPAGPL